MSVYLIARRFADMKRVYNVDVAVSGSFAIDGRTAAASN